MHDIRLTREGCLGTARAGLHLARHDGVVHVVSYAGGPAVARVCPDGTPAGDEFRMETRCGRAVKMYCGGRNRFTDRPPTCLRCVVAALNDKDFT